jgi:hypothetical protein
MMRRAVSRLYAICLAALPPSFRAAHGAAMAEVFARLVAESKAKRGGLGPWACLLREGATSSWLASRCASGS